jgi:carotenoid cleavage dioxygenase-like enzyme
MTTFSPQEPDFFLKGKYKPIHDEIVSKDLKPSKGEVPKDISGLFVRNGPNQQFPPRGYYHIFDGEGMLHAMHISNGKANYSNKYVQTEKFLLEKKFGKSLFFGLKHMMDPYALLVTNLEKLIYKHTSDIMISNTSVIYHADKLLSLQEASLPIEIERKNLSTVWFSFDSKQGWKIRF